MKIEKPTFKKLCFMHLQTLTNFPYIEEDFDAITDYELLCRVVHYLNNVIANENKLTESVISLTNAFNSLKDYVDSFFDNLDVQDEINNKLDEMVESGELQEIIATYLNSNAIFCFDTVADMKAATNFISGSYAKTLGFHSINDKGSSTYKIRLLTNEDVIDEMLLISLSNSELVAELIMENVMSLEQFGAYGDDEHDDTTSFITAINQSISLNNNGIYRLSFNGTLYNGGHTAAGNIKIKGGTYNCSGRLNYNKNLILDNVNINGDVWFTGVNYEGDIISITNSTFDVGELTFRLNNTDFNNVIIENNIINFYGCFWSSSQTEGISKGNVYIKNNEFIGKSVSSQSESYYCTCVVENEYIEFSNNNCHDFVISAGEYSVHDGYFGSTYVYVHDNKISNLDGGKSINNAILKAKNYGKRYFNNNYYEITSDINFPILQVQESDSEWNINNCTFKIKNCTSTDITNTDNIYINNCNFIIDTLHSFMFQNSYHMNNCNININQLNTNFVLSLNKGEISDTTFNVNTVDESVTTYGSIYGYTNFSNILNNVKSNISLIYNQFLGTIKNSIINVYDTCIVKQLMNCIVTSRNFRFGSSSSQTISFDISIISDGKIVGKRFSSDESITYTDEDTKLRISYTANNSYGGITIYDNPNDYSKGVAINLIAI